MGAATGSDPRGCARTAADVDDLITGGELREIGDGPGHRTTIGDSAPGQASGNNLNLNGGLWHEVTVSG